MTFRFPERTSGDFGLVVLDAKPPVILIDSEESAYNSLKQFGINIWKSQNQNVLLSDATEVHIDVQLAKEVGVSEVDLPAGCMTELADMWPTGQPAPGSASTATAAVPLFTATAYLAPVNSRNISSKRLV